MNMVCKLKLLADIKGSSGVLTRTQSSGIPTYERLDSIELSKLSDLISQSSDELGFGWSIDCYTDIHGNLGEFQKASECPQNGETSFRYYVVVDSESICQLKGCA